MDLIAHGLCEAGRLIASGDALVFAAAGRSLAISVAAVLVAGALAVPLGVFLADKAFPGRALLVLTLRGGMGMPTVLVGLLGFALFSRRGPLGGLDLLYTPEAVAICETLLAFPIVVSWTHAAVSGLDPRYAETSRTLGARSLRRRWTLAKEVRLSLVLALLTAFARCFSELGIAMMVGGNIKHRTRTLATATALETSRGEFARGLAMSLILLVIALLVALVAAALTRVREREAR
ncbi:MAG TPA: ABC transporter permease subunit [Planctomycetes bacterium]|nr:ABC transporter permease subunit [Planctomycetota bacterium]